MKKNFYSAFEQAHRGDKALIIGRLKAYTPLLNALRLEHNQGPPRAFDLGCGRGEWLALLGELGFKAQGVDLDEGMLASSLAQGLQVERKDGLLALQEMPDECLSLVSMFHLVEHLPFDTNIRIFDEAFRVLKPGGVLLLESPNPENVVVGTCNFYMDPTHEKPLPPYLLQFAVQHAGFSHASILRLNHPAEFTADKPLNMFDVLFHVSMDYAIVAIKGAFSNCQAGGAYDASISELHGHSLYGLSQMHADQQAAERALAADLKQAVNELQVRLGAIEHEMAQLKHMATDRPGFFQKVKRKLRAWQKPIRLKHVFVDVSNIATHDLNTGIERVVKNYIAELLKNPKLQVIPVKLQQAGGEWRYVTCMEYLGKVGINPQPDFRKGDLLWGLDYFPHGVHLAERSGVYNAIGALGVQLVFQVYDILPITHPQFFPPGASETHSRWLESLCRCADHLVCISHAVADSVQQWANGQKIVIKPDLHAVRLGANLPAVGLLNKTATPLDIEGYVLEVGTLEPRKGHVQALDAFDLLWKKGCKTSYVIVGKAGWQGVPAEHRAEIEALCTRIQQHPELGKKLWWLNQASDEELAALYKGATGVLVPSHEEGFGLPLIEAAHHGAPLLVRDIPVFREVAGEHATYFEGTKPEQLAQAIERWMNALQNQTAPGTTKLAWASWSQSLAAVLSSLGLK